MIAMENNKPQKKGKIWGGRFSEGTDAFVERFTASISFDKRLYQYDIVGSIAHAKMLAKAGIITEEEKLKIIEGLEDIAKKIANDEFDWSVKLEDIHMNIEASLTEKIGEMEAF